MTREYIIGTRGSELALWQANFVKTQLQDLFPERTFEIKIVKTTGDQLLDIALSKIDDKGLFTRQIEAKLLNGEIDFAVHSLKDLQTVQPEGLVIGAVGKREIPNDAFISKMFRSIDDLPTAARVATGSLRRRSQLLNFRPDLDIVEIRGNVPTRLKKFEESDLDGLILAYAGLHRLGLGDVVRQLIPFELMLPAVGQGAVAIEVREDDEQVADMTARLNDEATYVCVTAERAFLRTLEGGCQVPIGAFATLEKGRVYLDGMAGSLDGSTVLREQVEGAASSAESLGMDLAAMLIHMGADKLLSGSREKGSAYTEATMT